MGGRGKSQVGSPHCAAWPTPRTGTVNPAPQQEINSMSATDKDKQFEGHQGDTGVHDKKHSRMHTEVERCTHSNTPSHRYFYF